MSAQSIEHKVGEYQAWRTALIKAVSDYRNWLSRSDHSDAVKELRLYDIAESLKRDQLVMAFLAEFSRGKTETINALFFSDFGQRLLPSEAGRTTMCPAEIFWDGREEACIKLLPIDTRLTEDSLTYYKTTPNAWEKFRLDLSSPDQMKAMLQKLVEQKEVTQAQAEKLGLWSADDASMAYDLARTGLVKVPTWRHAIINYPHPLLKSGLVILDTPGLNSLGAEPELTLNIIPNAHAVLFLTASDSGITRSDLRIWNEFIKGRTKFKLAVLNKIDILWDDLKSKQDIQNEIDKQVNITAHQLNLSPDSVFAISAQKALVARIKKDQALLEQSGILKLENMLGEQIIQAKHEILGRTVASECGEMIKSSRRMLQQRLDTLRQEILELKSLRGQNADTNKHLLAQIVAERKRYEATIPTFNQANDKISYIGKKLLKHLSIAYLDTSISQSRQEMGDSWTTVGLNRGMRNLMKKSTDLADFVNKESNTIKRLGDNIYQVFRSRHGFEITTPPALNMSGFLDNMRALERITDDFCKDPVNVLTEKHFLIKRFYLGLVTQSQKIFAQAEKDCDIWLTESMGALQRQIDEHKRNLDRRSANLQEAKQSAEALEAKLSSIEKEYFALSDQSKALDEMLLVIVNTIRPAAKAAQQEKLAPELHQKTLKMADAPFLNVSMPASDSAH